MGLAAAKLKRNGLIRNMDPFFIIKKLNFLASVWTWVLAIFIVALIVRNPKLKQRLLLIGVLAALFFSNNFIVDELIRLWEVPVVPTREYEHRVQTAILLGGGLSYDKDVDRVNYGTNADRYIQVLEPLRNGLAQRVIVSGGAANLLEPWTYESDMLKRFLVNAGIDESRVITERESRTTYENALYCKTLLDSLEPNGTFLLVTSAIHMRRAVACFEAQGLNVKPYTVQKIVGNRRHDFSYLFIPSHSAIGRWDALLHEWAGYVFYQVTDKF